MRSAIPFWTLVFSIGLSAGCGSDPSAKDDNADSGTGRTCSANCAALAAPPCMKSVCNDGSLPGTAGQCVNVPVANGSSCEDGDPCTDLDACVDGTCRSGPHKDCSDLDSACNVGACDSSDGTCKASPLPDGTGCDDENPCTLSSACNAGTCAGERVKDCSALDTACTLGTCTPSDGSCKAVPRDNGTPCDDGNPCSVNDACSGGVCQSGAPKDCTQLTSACFVGFCVPTTGNCEARQRANGTTCDDGNPCTTGETCRDGACQGTTRNCSSLNTACAVGACDPRDGSCMAVPKTDGTACEAENRCLVGASCMGGACTGGTPKDCSASGAACTVGTCTPATGACTSVPAVDGTPCVSSNACIQGSTCSGGVCSGGTPPACSMTQDGCCPNGCSASNDADCSSCPGVEIAPSCVYMPSTASVTDKASAVTACAALGSTWTLCPPSVLCTTAAKQYLATTGCACGGGSTAAPLTCGCSTTQNLYIHVDGTGNNAYYVRDSAYFPTCISSASCTTSTSTLCGTPLCCRPL